MVFGKLKQWFSRRSESDPAPTPAEVRGGGMPRPSQPRPAPKKVPRPNPEFVDAPGDLSDDVEEAGPGKNVLIRNKFLREDTGTHETLKILDDSIVDSGEEAGIDPYNTGGFDRSRNWDKRFGK